MGAQGRTGVRKKGIMAVVRRARRTTASKRELGRKLKPKPRNHPTLVGSKEQEEEAAPRGGAPDAG